MARQTSRSAVSGGSLSWLSRWRIGTRLRFGNLLPLLLFAAFSGWMWWSLGQVRTYVDQRLTQDVGFSLLVLDMQREVVQVQQFLSDVSATRGQDGLDDGFQLAQASRKRFDEDAQRLEQYLRERGRAEPLAVLAQARQRMEAYYRAGVTMAQAYVRGGPPEGNPLMKPFDEASQSLQESMASLVEDSRREMVAEVGDVSHSAQLLRWWAVGLCGVVMLLGVGAGGVISRSITHPVRSAMQSLGRLAEGDLVFAIERHGRDEIAALLDSMRHMQQRFGELCGGVRDNAERVADASREIAQGNNDLSQRTERQASALQQTAASMSELDSTVRNNTASIQAANRLARDATEVSGRAAGVMRDMVSTMQGIHDSSRQISEIIGVIDGIAFQTNILALNAAVEAARAGEAGRGFAVVAAEVRGLASRSAEASRQIKGLITDSVSRVGAGAGLASDAGRAMDEVAEAIRRVTALMADIASASHQQEEGIAQINAAVQQMDTATQQNAALVEQMAASASSLQTLGQQLLAHTAVFRLPGREQAATPLRLESALS